MKDDERWESFGVACAFFPASASRLREERNLHRASRVFFEFAADLVNLSRYNYPLAAVAFFHAIPGLERALKLHYTTDNDDTRLSELLKRANDDGLVTESLFEGIPKFTPKFEKMVSEMIGEDRRTKGETFVSLVPKLRNMYFHGTYLLAPDYLHLIVPVRLLADNLQTRRQRL